MQVNDVVYVGSRLHSRFGIIKHMNEEEALVNFLGEETFLSLHELEVVGPDAMDTIVKAYFVQQYRAYQDAEISAAFEANITTRAYASGRDGLEIKFQVGGYSNQVTTGSFYTSVGVWLARETANVALAPQTLLA